MTQAAPGAARAQNDNATDLSAPASADGPGVPQQGPSKRDLRRLVAFKSRVLRRPGLGPVWAETARRHAIFSAVWFTLGVIALWQGRPAWALLPLVMLMLPFALAGWSYRSGRPHIEMLEAFATGDWSRLDGLVSKLRAMPGLSPAMAFDLDVRVIVGQVMRGRSLAEALASLSRWAPKVAESQPGLFDSRVATVHAAAGDRPGFVQRMRTACEASGREPSCLMELALAEARLGDPAAARTLLDAPELAGLPTHAAAFITWARGALALRSGQPGALGELSQAVAGFLDVAPSQPALWTALAFCTADLAMALSAAGHVEQARQVLSQVLPILRAHADKPLMHVLEQDILFAMHSPSRI